LAGEEIMPFSAAALLRGLFAIVFAMTATAASAATYMYVGNAASNEIVTFTLDPKTGELKEIDRFAVPGITKAGGSVPMAVSPNKKFLYAGFRGEPQVAAAFAIDGKSGKLKHLGNGALAHSMAYIATDRTGKWLLSASYPGHMVTVNPIGADGVVQAVKQSLPNLPNSHAILTDKSNRHVLSPSLGADAVNQFKFDPATGTLSANDPPQTKAAEKAGSRHFRFSRDEKFVYLNELKATINVFAYDAKKGVTSKLVQEISALPQSGPAEKVWAADIHLTPNGKYLYATERGTSTIQQYKVDTKSGMLTANGSVPTEKQPRAFEIDPAGKYLYAVGELSDAMSIYSIDAKSGVLGKMKQMPVGKNPNWIEIVEFR
jgi:6-phosphogluconolactonase